MRSEKSAVRSKKRVGSVKTTDRNGVRDEITVVAAWRPNMQMEARRLDLERWRELCGEVERDGVIGGRTDRCGDPSEHRHRSAVDVASRN